MDSACPWAEAVAVQGGRVVAVGDGAEAARALDTDAERIDCGDGILLPAFIDAHCHLLAYAASLRSVDCRAARSMADVQQSIRQRASETREGQWIRAFGYEDTALAERRHPDRRDLDAVAPGHPVRLIHSSGHASVLNSLALSQAGIDITTEEPPGGAMERDLASGEPTGLLLDMERLVDDAVPPPPYRELAAGVREAARRLLRAGVTCVQDASHTNGRAEWELFERLITDGSLPLDVMLMEGIDHLGELPETRAAGSGEPGERARLRRGAVKIMLHELGQVLTPDETELASLVGEVHAAGRQVAIHAVSERAVAATAEAVRAALGQRPRADHRHRIEHCSLLPPGLAPRLAQDGVVVVSQPAFVFERGDRYLQLVPEEQWPRLYPFRALLEAGVKLAAGSDAPVTVPEPLQSVASAVDRQTASGRTVAPEEAVGVDDALRWWTAGAAKAAFLERELGTVRPGLRADLVLLPPEAMTSPPRELRGSCPQRVWLKGRQVALEADSGP
jgi:predicted amidohydrolase YtcJ